MKTPVGPRIPRDAGWILVATAEESNGQVNMETDVFLSGKPLNVTVIQLYAPTTDAPEQFIRLPAPPMLMIDRVVEITRNGPRGTIIGEGVKACCGDDRRGQARKPGGLSRR